MIKVLLSAVIVSTAFLESGGAEEKKEKLAEKAPVEEVGTEVKPPSDLSDLSKLIPYGIALLEKKDYETFLKVFAKPELLEEAAPKGDLTELIADFKEQAGILLKAMKALKDIKPEIEDGGKLVTYSFPPELVKELGDTKEELVFERVGVRWYLQD